MGRASEREERHQPCLYAVWKQLWEGQETNGAFSLSPSPFPALPFPLSLPLLHSLYVCMCNICTDFTLNLKIHSQASESESPTRAYFQSLKAACALMQEIACRACCCLQSVLKGHWSNKQGKVVTHCFLFGHAMVSLACPCSL